jgi:cytochrome c-type biogenesis protein CcmH
VIAALMVVGLGRATFDDGPPRTAEEQVQAIASTMKCPVCRSQSVADSDVAAARAIRLEIARQLDDGRTPDEIRTAIASTYGSDVQLTPGATGMEGLVWILPVVVLVGALAALSAAFARWRVARPATATDDDRALVERALDDR